MVETVGKKLQQTRLRKQISIEQASHETKIRPEQLADLEKDDFANFPNITYAKGFLVIYAKYLGVDVSEFVGAFQNPNPVGTEDYEYLSNKPAPINSVSQGIKWGAWRTVIIAIVAMIVIAFIADLVVSFQRLGNIDKLAEKHDDTSASAKSKPSPALAAAAIPSATPQIVVTETPAPAPDSTPKAEMPSPSPNTAAAETPAVIDHTEVRRAEVVTHMDLIVPPLNSATSSPAPQVRAQKTVILQPVKKTWVKIIKDVQGSTPVFEDWFYPDARPLSFKGGKFWIEIRDKEAVKITKDGEPVPYDVPGVTIE